MPWKPHYGEAAARAAIKEAASWHDVLRALDYAYHGKNINTVRRWAQRWGISVNHFPDQRGRSASDQGRRRSRYTDEELRRAVAASRSWAETLRRLGYCPTGGNWKTLKKRTGALAIPTDHFDPYAASRERRRDVRVPLEEILVEGSTYNRHNLRRRLYEEGIKKRMCELCGQDETWRGKRMGLILDHANGVRDDNRLENLRIVCPNCAATLDTHCGRKNRWPLRPMACPRCARTFQPRYAAQRYCSRECGTRWDRTGLKRPGARRAERPPHERLLREVDELGYCAVGRTYGVSDNAIRKWLRDYERERLAAEGKDQSVTVIPTRTWPNRRQRPPDDRELDGRQELEAEARGRARLAEAA